MDARTGNLDEEVKKYMAFVEVAIQDGPKSADFLEYVTFYICRDLYGEERREKIRKVASRYCQFNEEERAWIVENMNPIWYKYFLDFKPNILKEVISGKYTGRGYQ